MKKSSKHARSAPPLLKYSAMAVFIILPFVAFFIGRQYQGRIDQQLQLSPASMPHTAYNITPTDQIPEQQFTKLVIKQMDSYHPETIYFSKVITNTSAIQKLYADMQKMPIWKFKKGDVYNCPMGTNIEYTLDFYSWERVTLHATLHPTGCANIAFNNQPRMLNNTVRNDIEQMLNLNDKSFGGYSR